MAGVALGWGDRQPLMHLNPVDLETWAPIVTKPSHTEQRLPNLLPTSHHQVTSHVRLDVFIITDKLPQVRMPCAPRQLPSFTVAMRGFVSARRRRGARHLQEGLIIPLKSDCGMEEGDDWA